MYSQHYKSSVGQNLVVKQVSQQVHERDDCEPVEEFYQQDNREVGAAECGNTKPFEQNQHQH